MKSEFRVTIEQQENTSLLECINVIEKPVRKPGRPRKFKENDKTEVIGVRLLENEVRFLEEYGGKFGGKTGYVTYLVREEMKKRGVHIDG